tara:strand:- start:5153 stop:5305 length:153 start_codon:yes stop_codon:yes gene_type:complete
MSILVNKVNDKQFPIEIVLNNKKQIFTQKAAIELLIKLQSALEDKKGGAA